jgi:hypothetical protein
MSGTGEMIVVLIKMGGIGDMLAVFLKMGGNGDKQPTLQEGWKW